MTKIIITTATELEMTPIMSYFGDKFIYNITGIGPVNCAISTIQAISEHHPNLILQVGIAGAVDCSLELCESVIVSSDYMADIGAWRGSGFERFDTQLIDYPYIVDGFRSVAARTVSTACATWINDESAIESMEGAAFMQAAKAMGCRYMQMRTISNYVHQPRSEWRVAQAVAALPAAVERLLQM